MIRAIRAARRARGGCRPRRFLWTALVLCLCLLVPAAGSWAQSAPVAVRVLVSQTTAALPFLQMVRDGVPGAELKVDFFANHAQALAVLLRGETDLLLSGTSQGWENRLDGSPIVMLDTGVWGVSSLVGKDASIKGFADLKGKRIAVPFPGSPLDFQSRVLLAFDKLDPDKDVTISFGPFAQSVQRLLAGQLDAAALPEPLATMMVKKNGLRRLVQYSQAWARFTGGDPQSPQVSLFATEGWAREHAPLIGPILSAWDSASRTVSASPGAAASAFASALSVDQSVLEEATRNTLLSVPSVQENKARVLSYYQAVSKYLPAGSRPLDERFFVAP
jgi:ABC-type nitrate/sulfonate/bicarbonate transport system substrate-binding protein